MSYRSMRLAVVLAVLVLSACGSLYNTLAPAADDEAAKKFEAVPDSAVIYVYREESLVAAIQAFRVFLDRQHVADFTPARFIRLVTSPGSHEVAVRTISNASINDTLTLETEPGGIYYVELEVGAGVASGRPSLTRVEATRAQTEIRKTSLIVQGFPTR